MTLFIRHSRKAKLLKTETRCVVSEKGQEKIWLQMAWENLWCHEAFVYLNCRDGYAMLYICENSYNTAQAKKWILLNWNCISTDLLKASA